jgi:hypothetical protein
MQNQAPWEIKLSRKAKILAEFKVPGHKLSGNGLKAFLKAIVASERAGNPESMMLFYVNKRRGEPSRLPFAETCKHEDLKRNRVGFFCGDWECHASAFQKIDASTVKWIKQERERSRRI